MSISKYKWHIYTILIIVGILINTRDYIYIKYMHFYLRDKPVVVSLSTTPHRIHRMQETIDTILSQSFLPSKIYLSVPFIFKRDNLIYEIPQWLANNDRITILRTEDYGPATKLLGLLAEHYLAPETIIITVDDDIKYPPDYLLHLAYKSAKNPDRAIGYAGVNVQYNSAGLVSDEVKNGIVPVYIAEQTVSILQGFGAVAYRRSFFDNDIFDILDAPKECYNADDFWISYHLARKNIPREILRNKFVSKFMVDIEAEYSLDENALHRLVPTPAQKHRKCVEFMRQVDPYVVF